MGWGKFVIVSSNAIARHMIKDFGVPQERIRLIPRGVDINKFPYQLIDSSGNKKKKYIIGMIGRITPIKGHIYLIRAISNVIRFMPNIKVFIIGDPPASKPYYKRELEALVKRLSLSGHIEFMRGRSDIPAQLAKMDLVVVPSVGEEAFGRVILEAGSSGTCVIATRVGGIVDIIKDGENGILVPPRDYNSLAEAIMKLLKDDQMRQRLAKAASLNVEKNFTLSDMYEKTIGVYNEALTSFKILILKWSALGDIILSLPALRAVKERFPKSDIIMLTSRSGREILSRYPYIKDFMIFQNLAGIKGIKEILNISAELRKASIDMVLDLQNNKKSHIISFLSFAPRRIGYRSGKLDFLLTESIGGARIKIPPVAHQFRLLKLLDADITPKPTPLNPSDEEIRYAEEILKEGWIGGKETLVGLNCGASFNWQTKRWPVERIAKLCDILSHNRIRVVVTGTKKDRPQLKKLSLLAKSKYIDIAGKTTIMQLAAIIQKCDVFVTPDSAPMHIASSLGVPFVALFGVTDPTRHLEPGLKYRVIYKGVKCSPCYRPRCSNLRCMKEISAEEVAKAVIELIGEKSCK
jgi:lipopolysaccharide heptosyltransferase II